MSREHRLFVDVLPPDGGVVALDRDAAHHVRVLRLGAGDPVVLFDGTGREASARLRARGPSGLSCEAHPPRTARQVGPRVVLVQCVPKGQKLDTVVRMCTEMGVTAIHLAVSERTISRSDDRRAESKVARLGRIAREATRQSQRAVVPTIEPAAKLAEVASRAPADAARCLLSTRSRRAFGEGFPEGATEAWLAVGPEGGFTEDEERALEAEGFTDVTLGSGVLRTETAGPAAVLLALDRLGALAP